MKSKITLRCSLPNLQRFRTRVANPSKDLTKQVREILTDVVCETLNESTLAIRAKFIAKVNALNLKYTSEAHQGKVMSVVEPFFDAIFAKDPAALAAITGDTEEDEDGDDAAEVEGEAEGEPAGDTNEAPADPTNGTTAPPADDFDE